MKKSIYLFFVLTVPMAFGQNQKADSLLAAYLQKSQSIGMVAGVAKGGARMTLSDGFANRESNESISTKTKVRIASVSKILTATAIMQLVERGKLQLDQRVAALVPDLPAHLSEVTVRQLLDHSSGIRAYQSSKERENTKAYASLKEAAKIFVEDELEADPGQQFSYTTYGYVLLGLVIENVSSQSYEAYMNTHILAPLAMENTGVEQYSALPKPISEVYFKNGKGKVRHMPRTDLSDRIPGGGFYSTVDDMLTFGEALISGKLISRSSFEQMTKDSGLKKQGNPYGLGLYLYGENPNYGNVVGHSGTQRGASVQLMLLPDIGAVTFVASNTSRTWEDVFVLSVLYFQLTDDL